MTNTLIQRDVLIQQARAELGVTPMRQFNAEHAIRTRLDFLKSHLKASGLRGFVLGISGGVDSLTAGMLAQRAVDELNRELNDEHASTSNSTAQRYQFIAMRLPYGEQRDESEAQHALAAINPDLVLTVNIQAASDALHHAVLQTLPSHTNSDFQLGNVKTRQRMVAQYDVAGMEQLMVIGTDHNAEALMAFYTKFGDGACDIAPLQGLNKRQVRTLAQTLGAPASLYNKQPTADLENDRPQIADETVLGVSYDEIDDFLEGKLVSDNAIETILRWYDKGRHKREPIYSLLTHPSL
uniref:ammonia-dependent NAD(+) synthetase n=1 Tax=Thaumasiovibrio occultus TaxID=1891184 RepID=UPI000B34BEAC|nr:ammonia-dependent NAD(+) synthetase [Thaumasiovibrio occultus]